MSAQVEWDRGPVMLNGAVRGYRIRAVIADGHLHVVYSASRIDKIKLTGELKDDPARSGVGYQAWTVETEKGLVLITNRGCKACGYTLGRVKLSKILA